MYQDHQGFYKEQCKEGEEGAEKRGLGRITSMSGQGCVCDALSEAENKTKWREKVARSVAT